MKMMQQFIIFAATFSFVIANVTSATTSDRCILPQFPKDGFYDIAGQYNVQPGQAFDRVNLDFACRPGFKLQGPSTISCLNGEWNNAEQPKCLSQCELKKHPSVKYFCLPNNSKSFKNAYECNGLVDEATTVRPQCQSPDFYSTDELTDMRCDSGLWNYVAICTPECGVITDNTQLNIAGRPANRGNTPWHVGVYYKQREPYLQVCGGSIITSKVVISAAHCFWRNYGKPRPASDFVVAAGKLFRLWNSPRDLYAQKSDIQEIRFPESFNGVATNFRNDIAALTVTTSFKFGAYVRPVCVDFDFNFERNQLTVGRKGKIASWGRSAEDGLDLNSQFLQDVDLPYLNVERCLAEAPTGFREIVTVDKFCAYHNDTARELCRGDTGGGLTFPARGRGGERYFMRGVASTARGDEEYCIMFTTFTQVIRHEQFIRQFYTPLKHKCVLPPFPDHGTYSSNVTNGKPGDAYDFVSINVTCQQEYEINGSSLVPCYSGWWPDPIPTCVPQCRLVPHASVEYICLDSDGRSRVCNEYEPSGTVVDPRCRSPDFYSKTDLVHMRCIDGSWNYKAKCSPECGISAVEDPQISIHKRKSQRGEVPWFVSMYNKTESNNPLNSCSGSLISNTLVLSVASCFWDNGGHMKTQERARQCVVAVDKEHQALNDTRDQTQQISDVKELHIPPRYQGYVANYQDDIAVIVVKVAFKFNSFVRPVCLNFDQEFETKQLQLGNKGRVAEWGLHYENPLRELLLVDLPYVDVETCLGVVGNWVNRYLASDKICGGYANVSGLWICVDSGIGWAFPASDGHKQRYYLRGVASRGYNFFRDCFADTYIAFTQIAKHEHFIKKFWSDL